MTYYKYDHTFMATVLLEQPARIEFQALQSAVAALMPGIAAKMVGSGTATMFGMDGRHMTLLEQTKPVPEGVFRRAIAMAEHRWRDAAARVAAHGAHTVVAAFHDGTGHADLMIEAINVTLVAAAISAIAPALAIHWGSSESLVDPAMFRTQAASLRQDMLPLPLWLQLIPLTLRDRAGVPRRAMTTEGLKAFAGFEIDFAASDTVTHEQMARRILPLVDELIRRGPVARDGATYGLTAADRCRIAFRPEGVRPGLPVLVLTAESLDPAADRVPSGLGLPGAAPPKPFGKRGL